MAKARAMAVPPTGILKNLAKWPASRVGMGRGMEAGGAGGKAWAQGWGGWGRLKTAKAVHHCVARGVSEGVGREVNG